MADERTTALRAMATHQGFKLLTSRRRKPGGDFGRYGLEDADGEPAIGVGKDGLEASGEDIEAFLRDRARGSWASSTKGLKRSKAPPPPPKPEPKPQFKPAVANLFAKLPAARRAEAFTELFAGRGARIERIVSGGQVTPDDAPMRQDHDEWVIVLAGEAGLRIEDSDPVTLEPGDHVTIAAGQKHWVTHTAANPPTVLLAVHLS